MHFDDIIFSSQYLLIALVWTCRYCDTLVCSSCALIRIKSDPAGFLEQAPTTENIEMSSSLLATSSSSWNLPTPPTHPLYDFQSYELTPEQEQQIIHHPDPLPLFYSFWDLFFRQISYRESQTTYWSKKRKMLAHPHFGHATTPIEAVHRFYNFWSIFESHWGKDEMMYGFTSSTIPGLLNRLKQLDPRYKADIVRERLQKRAEVHSKMRATGRVYTTYFPHTPYVYLHPPRLAR